MKTDVQTASQQSTPILALNGLTKRYRHLTAVDRLSFAVRPGEIFGFLGPNGAGKTTTLRMILDIVQPTSGTLEILGASQATPVRQRIGYLPEERGLYRKMRAARSIAYFGRLRGMTAGHARKRALDLMVEFDLGDFTRTRNEALSKGMAQKVQLLGTLVHDPELLILDEPFSGLDPINQKVLEDLIRRLRAQGKSIIFSTHVMEHAERLCDRFLILAKGRKRFEGTLEEARGRFPPRLLIRTADPVDPLSNVPGVIAIRRIGDHDSADEQDYELDLEAGADSQAILAAAFEQGIRLSRFEQVRQTLHDIFVSIAGASDPDEAAA